MLIIEILRHTPAWVWLLATGLLALGLSQLRERRIAPWRLWLLPGVLLGLGVLSLTQSFSSPLLPLVVWTKAVALAAAVGRRLPPPAGLRVEAGRLVLPGSALPLTIIAAVFGLRYAGGVALAMHPAWRADLTVALPMAAGYGAIGGLLLGRTIATAATWTARATAAAQASGGQGLAVPARGRA